MTTNPPSTDWLEWDDPRGQFHGRFPEGALNGKQLEAIITLNDRRYGRVQGLHPGRVINKLTSEIVEVHLRVGTSDVRANHCVLWLDINGRQLASAIVLENGRAISYWIPLEKFERPWANVPPIEKSHRYGMHSLGLDGALALTRQYIHDTYVNKEA